MTKHENENSHKKQKFTKSRYVMIRPHTTMHTIGLHQLRYYQLLRTIVM